MRLSTRLLSFGALAALVMALGACSLLTNPIKPVADSGKTGAITVRIQRLSAPLQAAIDKVFAARGVSSPSRAATSRAFLAAGQVDFVVTNDDTGSIADQWSVYPPDQNPLQPTTMGVRTLPAGNYTLAATVYNAQGDTTPTVSGSKSFSVAAGQSASSNPVVVTCRPANPQTLSNHTDVSFTLPESWVMDFDTGAITTFGDEKWFEFTAADDTDTTTVTLTPGLSAIAIGFVFDSTGTFGGEIDPQDMTFTPGESSSASWSTTPGEVYYLAVINLTFADTQNAQLSIRVDSVTNVVDNPISITPSSSYQPQSIQSYHTALYTFQGLAGHVYAVNWDSYTMGSGQYTADVYVTATNADQSVTYFSGQYGYKGSDFYERGVYYPYAIDQTKCFQPSVDATISLIVNESVPGASSGSFALMVQDLGTNHPPTVYAYADSDSVAVGSSVGLWAYGSDTDGDALTYTWEIVAGPSAYGLDTSDPQHPTFSPDTAGTYEIQVTCTDNGDPPYSGTYFVLITAIINNPPQIDYAYPSVAEVTLDGAPTVDLYGSAWDPDHPNDNSGLSYEWSFYSTPVGSNSSIQDAWQANAFFSPDVAGTYVLELTVTDELGAQDWATFEVVATPGTGGGVTIGIE